MTTAKGQRICPGCQGQKWQAPGVPKGTLCVGCQRDCLAEALRLMLSDPSRDGLLTETVEAARAALAKAEGK